MPQKRGIPADEVVRRLMAAVDALAAAKEERDAAIADALKLGASTREVGRVVGLSGQQVANIGHARGWPTPAQQRARDEQRAAKEAWDAAFAAYLAEHRTGL